MGFSLSVRIRAWNKHTFLLIPINRAFTAEPLRVSAFVFVRWRPCESTLSCFLLSAGIRDSHKPAFVLSLIKYLRWQVICCIVNCELSRQRWSEWREEWWDGEEWRWESGLMPVYIPRWGLAVTSSLLLRSWPGLDCEGRRCFLSLWNALTQSRSLKSFLCTFPSALCPVLLPGVDSWMDAGVV